MLHLLLTAAFTLSWKGGVGDFGNIRGERKDSEVQEVKLDLKVDHIKI